MTPATALTDLLASLFSADEFRRWIRRDSDVAAILDALPGEVASSSALFADAVAALARHGLIDGAFFAGLRAERPRRAADIDDVAASWQGSRGSAARGPAATTSAPPRSEPVQHGAFIVGDHTTIHVRGDFVQGAKNETHHHHGDKRDARRPRKT
jgi:hypothetical protein